MVMVGGWKGEVVDNGDGTVTVKVHCTLCNKPNEITVSKAEWEAWDKGHGPFIQTAMPSLSAGDREGILSGSHEACFDAMFAEDEEDDEWT